MKISFRTPWQRTAFLRNNAWRPLCIFSWRKSCCRNEVLLQRIHVTRPHKSNAVEAESHIFKHKIDFTWHYASSFIENYRSFTIKTSISVFCVHSLTQTLFSLQTKNRQTMKSSFLPVVFRQCACRFFLVAS